MTRKKYLFLMVLFASALSTSACYDSLIEPVSEDIDELYWQVNVNHQAVQLSLAATYDTIQLNALPYDAYRNVLPPVPEGKNYSVVWKSSDTSSVKVSQDGLVTARKIANRVNITVALTVGNITHTDTVWIRVAPLLSSAIDSFVIFVPSGEDKVASGGSLQLSSRAKARDGTPISGLPVKYRVSNPWIATFKNTVGVVHGLIPDDSIYAYATTRVNGVTMTDSIFLYTGWPVGNFVKAFFIEQRAIGNGQIDFRPTMINYKRGPGSSFIWQNTSGFGPVNTIGLPPKPGMILNIKFDRPDLALPLFDFPPFNQGGDIIGLQFDTTNASGLLIAPRKFMTPGEHHYTVEPLGVRGTITISER